jgi:hypothetical protein
MYSTRVKKYIFKSCYNFVLNRNLASIYSSAYSIFSKKIEITALYYTHLVFIYEVGILASTVRYSNILSRKRIFLGLDYFCYGEGKGKGGIFIS